MLSFQGYFFFFPTCSYNSFSLFWTVECTLAKLSYHSVCVCLKFTKILFQTFRPREKTPNAVIKQRRESESKGQRVSIQLTTRFVS